MRTAATVLAVVLGVLAAALAGAAPASAATSYVWTGAGDGTSWTDAVNWSPANVPGDGDAVTVLAPSDDVCRAHVRGIPTGVRLADLTVDERLFHGNPDSPCLTSLDDGAITVTHALTFHAGTITSALTVAAGATATVTPGAAHDTTHLAGAVTVDGTLTVAATTDPENLSLTGGSVTVDPGGVFVASGDNHLTADCCQSTAHLTNRGTVQLGSGTLTLGAVELDQDAVLTAAGGTVVSLVAPQTAGDGARWTGPGTWRLGTSTVTTVSGTQTLGKGFTWQYGGHGSTAQEHLLGRFTLAGTGTFAWDGGAIDAAMTTGTGVKVVAAGGDPTAVDGRVLDGLDSTGPVTVTVRGAVTFSGGAGWYGVDGGSLVIASTATLTLAGGTTAGADGAASGVVNQGGTVAIPSGTVRLAATGYRAVGGTLKLGRGADLELTGAAPSSLSTTTVTGSGTFGLATPVSTSGTVTIDTGTNLKLRTGSTLTTAETDPTTIGGAGSFAWTGGAVTGRLTVATTGGQTVSGPTAKQLTVPTGASPTVLTFTGPTALPAGTATSPNLVQGDATSQLAFTGAVTIAGNTRITGAAVTTSGTTTVAAGNVKARIDSGATLINRGALTVASGNLAADATVRQTGGSTTVAAGASLSTPTFKVDGGTVTGAGTVRGTLALTAATLDPAGTLTVTKALTTTAASTLHLDLDAAGHDAVAVGGNATVRGTVVLADAAGYTPASGDTATVLTAATLTLATSCVTTTGDAAAAQHWFAAPADDNTDLRITSVAGPGASC